MCLDLGAPSGAVGASGLLAVHLDRLALAGEGLRFVCRRAATRLALLPSPLCAPADLGLRGAGDRLDEAGAPGEEHRQRDQAVVIGGGLLDPVDVTRGVGVDEVLEALLL